MISSNAGWAFMSAHLHPNPILFSGTQSKSLIARSIKLAFDEPFGSFSKWGSGPLVFSKNSSLYSFVVLAYRYPYGGWP